MVLYKKNPKAKNYLICIYIASQVLTKSFKLCLMNTQINNIILGLLLLLNTYFMFSEYVLSFKKFKL